MDRILICVGNPANPKSLDIRPWPDRRYSVFKFFICFIMVSGIRLDIRSFSTGVASCLSTGS